MLWGILVLLEQNNIQLFINNIDLDHYANVEALAVDVETDESDNFVGLALTKDGHRIDYITFGFNGDVIPKLLSNKLIGHNLKGDMKWLKQWGLDIKSSQLFYDTALASYVQNTTKETQSLKDLAKEYLGMEWWTYKQMVGKGKTKVTLDKQPIEKVAQYCGMDCLATYRLYEYFNKTLNSLQKEYLQNIELPTARALFEMEVQGVRVDVEYLKRLDSEFEEQIEQLSRQIFKQARDSGALHDYYEPIDRSVSFCACDRSKTGKHQFVLFNVNSNAQIARLLEAQGAALPKTPKGSKKVDRQTLEQWQHLPVVALLLEYSKIEKLKSTYTGALLEKHKEGRIFCKYNQISRNAKGTAVGISTGRLSSSEPNLQNIPARTKEGSLIRKAFIPKDNQVFIDADYSQIEYRLLAHFTKEPVLLEAFRNDKDIHEETGKLLGTSRDIGKTLNFASIYGAQASKIARTAKIDVSDAERFLKQYWSKLPRVTAWINRVKYEAKQKRGVWTLNRRWIPIPKIVSIDKYDRLHWERVAVNTIIQGSAAEIMKMALIELHKIDLIPVLTAHDEFVFDVEPKDELYALDLMARIKIAMESVVELDVPLIADVGAGKNWGEAKL